MSTGSGVSGRPPAAVPPGQRRPALLIVTNPSGNRSRVPIEPVPFLIGRSSGNHLVLRDNRISRSHARISVDNGSYVIEDLKSRHGMWINGQKLDRRILHDSDRIEFGFPDSYRLTFSFEEHELNRILDQMPSLVSAGHTSNLGKLRALVEVARTLQSALSTDDVLTAVVDAALAVTGTERGFLLLTRGKDLDMRVARDSRGRPLGKEDLKVPTSVIHRALSQRRELLSMSFDPLEEQGVRPESTIASLELRSVVCVPLVRVRTASTLETSLLSAVNDTTGLLYMDSRGAPADLSQGNRELLQTLALEASTVLENARLLDEEREKQRLEEELNIARSIQRGLLPAVLPRDGWFRAAGSSLPSAQVGGDYFDVRQLRPDSWLTIVADVSGKGVSSALLASLLQGAFLLADDDPDRIRAMLSLVNGFLLERTRGEKYATVFYGAMSGAGRFTWANAGHCEPFLVKADGSLRKLSSTGFPIGMMESAVVGVENLALGAGDKVVIYSDGLTEAENADGGFYGTERLRQVLRDHAHGTCDALHAAILESAEHFSEGCPASDDITVVVLEFCPEPYTGAPEDDG